MKNFIVMAPNIFYFVSKSTDTIVTVLRRSHIFQRNHPELNDRTEMLCKKKRNKSTNQVVVSSTNKRLEWKEQEIIVPNATNICFP